MNYLQKRLLAALIIAFLCLATGCVQLLPASANKTGEHEYVITAFGNSFAGRDLLESKVDKKAEKVCKQGIESKNAGEYRMGKEESIG